MADEKMARLTAAKEKVEKLTRKKERLSGVAETKKARVEELEGKAQKDFGCDVADIPDAVEKLDAEATAALQKAETMLEPKETPEPESVEEEADEDALPV